MQGDTMPEIAAVHAAQDPRHKEVTSQWNTVGAASKAVCDLVPGMYILDLRTDKGFRAMIRLGAAVVLPALGGVGVAGAWIPVGESTLWVDAQTSLHCALEGADTGVLFVSLLRTTPT